MLLVIVLFVFLLSSINVLFGLCVDNLLHFAHHGSMSDELVRIPTTGLVVILSNILVLLRQFHFDW